MTTSHTTVTPRSGCDPLQLPWALRALAMVASVTVTVVLLAGVVLGITSVDGSMQAMAGGPTAQARG